MEGNHLTVAIVYFITGGFFTYLSVQSIDMTIWNGTTILLIIVATLGFGTGIRYLRSYFKNKHKEG